MKYIHIIALITSLHAYGELQQDKAAHFGIAYAANTLAYSLITPSFCLNNPVCGHIMAAMVVGIASVWWEVESGKVDPADLRADAIGIGASILTIRLIEYRF